MSDPLVHPVDRMSDLEFMREMVAFFGTRRTTELIGWSVLAGLAAWPDSPQKFREDLADKGFSRSSMFLALQDMRRFGKMLEDREGWVAEVPHGLKLLKRLGNCRAA